MRATVKWLDNVAFEGTAGSGHKVLMDGPPDAGGQDRGVRPMEMLLLGLGGCTAFDVVFILQRGRHPVSDCVVEIEAARAEQAPKVFTRIHLHYKVSGEGLSEAAVKRAVELSAEKYCSASLMLAKAADLTHSYELV
ncbi:OsmC family protein [Alkalilimnicola sp. S0819]|uniref:OsmC family protein n=1 Tax=Alkalilimnicola sp. S0819 TaxID=2613922 RepID=UPI00126265B0|nr:OsmC family protein [Alkalilimnicola sp. S0819]KAB7628158.1 OsmC family protein [Alkalilimnicola sp. S0819]MPQ15044.1 OsmC family protein [Alkalilimnicola sp. S0819]